MTFQQLTIRCVFFLMIYCTSVSDENCITHTHTTVHSRHTNRKWQVDIWRQHMEIILK